jgi:hypothetical protein
VYLDRLGSYLADLAVLVGMGHTATRLPRATQVVRWSRRAATMTTWTARPAIVVRNTATQLMGRIAPSAMLRGLGPVYNGEPPAAGG